MTEQPCINCVYMCTAAGGPADGGAGDACACANYRPIIIRIASPIIASCICAQIVYLIPDVSLHPGNLPPVIQGSSDSRRLLQDPEAARPLKLASPRNYSIII